MGCPALHPNAFSKAAEFCTAPFDTPMSGGMWIDQHALAGFLVGHVLTPYLPEREEESLRGVYPSLSFAGVLPMMLVSAM